MNGKRLDAIFACTGGGGLLSGLYLSLSCPVTMFVVGQNVCVARYVLYASLSRSVSLNSDIRGLVQSSFEDKVKLISANHIRRSHLSLILKMNLQRKNC